MTSPAGGGLSAPPPLKYPWRTIGRHLIVHLVILRANQVVPLQLRLQFPDSGLGRFGAGFSAFGADPFLCEGGNVFPGFGVLPAQLSVFPLDEEVEHADVPLRDPVLDGLDGEARMFSVVEGSTPLVQLGSVRARRRLAPV